MRSGLVESFSLQNVHLHVKGSKIGKEIKCYATILTESILWREKIKLENNKKEKYEERSKIQKD